MTPIQFLLLAIELFLLQQDALLPCGVVPRGSSVIFLLLPLVFYALLRLFCAALLIEPSVCVGQSMMQDGQGDV